MVLPRPFDMLTHVQYRSCFVALNPTGLGELFRQTSRMNLYHCLDLNFDIDARRQIQPHQHINRL